jgi:hypothetical protein
VKLIDTGEAVARQVLRVAPKSDHPQGNAIAYVTGGAATAPPLASALNRFGYHMIEVVDL